METDEAVTVLARSAPGPENPRRILFYLTIVAALGYGALLIQNLAFGVGGSDSSGYANTARLILSGRASAPIDALDLLGLPDRFGPAFTPLAFRPGQRPKTMVPMYPPGFPLHIAVAALVVGWEAGPFVVSPLAALLTLGLFYALGRELKLSRPLSLAGAAILGGCAVYLFQAVQPMSDVVATAWCVGAVLFALRARRGRSYWALLSGVAFGIAVLVRPTDALLALPIAFALPWRPQAIVLFVAGAVPAAAFYGVWNHAAYGSILTTGYAGIDEFKRSNLAPRLRNDALSVVMQLSPLVPLGWAAVSIDAKVPVRDRAMLLTWFASFYLVYGFWTGGDVWWTTRYLLPALPALVLGFLLATRDLLHAVPERERGGPRRHLRAVLALVVLAAVGLFEWRMAQRFHPLRFGPGQAVYRDACRWLVEKAGERSAGKALIVSMAFSGSVRFYTDFQPLRWDVVSSEDFAAIRARAAERGYRIFGVVLPWEISQARPHVPGRWTLVQTFEPATIWRLD